MKRLAILTISLSVVVLPAGASAHDRDGDSDRRGWHGVALLGMVTSVNSGDEKLTVKVKRASWGGKSLVGETVSVKVSRLWVKDRNDDGEHTIADVREGDGAFVKTAREFLDKNAGTVSKSMVFAGLRKHRGDSSRRDGDGRCDKDD